MARERRVERRTTIADAAIDGTIDGVAREAHAPLGLRREAVVVNAVRFAAVLRAADRLRGMRSAEEHERFAAARTAISETVNAVRARLRSRTAGTEGGQGTGLEQARAVRRLVAAVTTALANLDTETEMSTLRQALEAGLSDLVHLTDMAIATHLDGDAAPPAEATATHQAQADAEHRPRAELQLPAELAEFDREAIEDAWGELHESIAASPTAHATTPGLPHMAHAAWAAVTRTFPPVNDPPTNRIRRSARATLTPATIADESAAAERAASIVGLRTELAERVERAFDRARKQRTGERPAVTDYGVAMISNLVPYMAPLNSFRTPERQAAENRAVHEWLDGSSMIICAQPSPKGGRANRAEQIAQRALGTKVTERGERNSPERNGINPSALDDDQLARTYFAAWDAQNERPVVYRYRRDSQGRLGPTDHDFAENVQLPLAAKGRHIVVTCEAEASGALPQIALDPRTKRIVTAADARAPARMTAWALTNAAGISLGMHDGDGRRRTINMLCSEPAMGETLLGRRNPNAPDEEYPSLVRPDAMASLLNAALAGHPIVITHGPPPAAWHRQLHRPASARSELPNEVWETAVADASRLPATDALDVPLADLQTIARALSEDEGELREHVAMLAQLDAALDRGERLDVARSAVDAVERSRARDRAARWQHVPRSSGATLTGTQRPQLVLVQSDGPTDDLTSDPAVQAALRTVTERIANAGGRTIIMGGRAPEWLTGDAIEHRAATDRTPGLTERTLLLVDAIRPDQAEGWAACSALRRMLTDPDGGTHGPRCRILANGARTLGMLGAEHAELRRTSTTHPVTLIWGGAEARIRMGCRPGGQAARPSKVILPGGEGLRLRSPELHRQHEGGHLWLIRDPAKLTIDTSTIRVTGQLEQALAEAITGLALSPRNRRDHAWAKRAQARPGADDELRTGGDIIAESTAIADSMLRTATADALLQRQG